MANGDAAQAVGFTPVPSTKDKRLGYDDINRAADFTAAHMTSGGHDFSRITGQAATSQIANGAITTAKHADASVTTPKLAPGAVTKPKLSPGSVDGDIVATTVSKSGPLNIQGSPLRLRTPDTDHAVAVATTGVGIVSSVEVGLEVGSAAAVTLTPGEVTVEATTVTVGGSVVEVSAVEGDLTLSADKTSGEAAVNIEAKSKVRMETESGNEFAVGPVGGNHRVYSEGIRRITTGASANVRIDDTNGVLVRSTSSRRYKDDIADAPPAPAVLDIRPRTWVDKGAPPDAPRYFGAIAEELHDLGLAHLVAYDDEGRPEAIAYDRVAIALIPVVRDAVDRLAVLEQRLEALSTKGA
ncbi:tail fiber domain-containing protein [Cellulomonas composti]|uniref:Peptidase S74 domain-containing protein n=1 Tax=Cellulomonas composti TaxID=266130 RepID=A0A511JBI4_9CELL|nr:tail fiber domain-containing protein [Cellulomonas composti]GEL95352.1 hypothetical protein CCO02nite_20100 [Cellulomonas composti]